MTRGLYGLGLDSDEVGGWFAIEDVDNYSVARLSPEVAAGLAADLATAVRRCYVDDDALLRAAATTGRPQHELIAAKLPDAGPTMSGDFGEILAYAFLAASRLPAEAFGPYKWRLKQDRTKPVPHSDVVLFIVPSWPNPSVDDVLVCAEVKAKARAGDYAPIPEALSGSERDRTSRLARTLEWFRERAMFQPLDGVGLDMLDRFAHASESPAASREFLAVAVVADALVDDELLTLPDEPPPECSLVVLVVPDLHGTYTAVFRAAATEVIETGAA